MKNIEIFKSKFVTSIAFIQEPEYGENNPSDKFISQYPLEDVLDKFECSINDTYKDSII